jgi:hypothetical protein
MKKYLAQVDRHRMEEYAMPTMTAAALPPAMEMTMKLAGQWEREHDKEEWRRGQGDQDE